jgi:antitoxin ParD1/3/4
MVRTGLYQSHSEVLREALRLLQEQKRTKEMELERLRREIAIGAEQARRGELFDGEAVFAELLRRSRRQRRSRK